MRVFWCWADQVLTHKLAGAVQATLDAGHLHAEFLRHFRNRSSAAESRREPLLQPDLSKPRTNHGPRQRPGGRYSTDFLDALSISSGEISTTVFTPAAPL